jgi:hypothetical protein
MSKAADRGDIKPRSGNIIPQTHERLNIYTVTPELAQRNLLIEGLMSMQYERLHPALMSTMC